MNQGNVNRDLGYYLLYALGFVLVWEYLRPLEELTKTKEINVFIAFLLIAFAGAMFRLPMIVQFFIKTFYILYSVYRFYFSGGFFMLKWWKELFSDVKDNFGLLFSQDYQQLTDVFRTILFFILLWLMVYLIQYWLLNRRRIFVFFLMTIIYITVLDTFTTYKGDAAIVRTVISGFTVMGILTYFRLLSEGKLEGGKKLARKWMIPLAGMVLFSTAVGIAAPKAAPVWPDPVPFLKSLNENAGDGTAGVSRIGYGTNDSRLGGPFIPDNTIVFRAESSSRHYWKVETKDVYTGKGWVLSSSGSENASEFSKGAPVPLPEYPPGVKREEEKAQVYMYLKYPHLAYPQGVREITADGNTTFILNTVSEKILTRGKGSRPVKLDGYGFTYEVPSFKMDDLQWAKEVGQTGINKEFYNRYTQLPETLPARVRELASSIAGDETTWYEQAKAIERYFDGIDFVYDQKNVEVPAKEEDYVDQFLFETKTGYCDNYSSSMVVLLRSIGIPSRWVKGYTEGEKKTVEDGGKNKQLYEITNNNAHSWVEVFLPNLGWIPFEPTKGFANNIQIDYELDKNQSGGTPAAPIKPAKPKPNQLDRLEGDVPVSKKGAESKNVFVKTKIFLKNEWKWLIAGLAALAALVMFIYSKRGRWLPYYLIYRFRFLRKDEHFSKAYLVLLGQFGRFGLVRKEGQTLRNYAGYIDNFFSTKEMGRLTSRYEQYLYRREMPEGTWKELKELWENLIRKTIA